jgi:hypothetical protein
VPIQRKAKKQERSHIGKARRGKELRLSVAQRGCLPDDIRFQYPAMRETREPSTVSAPLSFQYLLTRETREPSISAPVSDFDDCTSITSSLKARRVEEVPSHNKHICSLARNILAGMFMAKDPWPEPAVIDSFIEDAWTKARKHLEEEQKKNGPNSMWRVQEADHEPDEISERFVGILSPLSPLKNYPDFNALDEKNS